MRLILKTVYTWLITAACGTLLFSLFFLGAQGGSASDIVTVLGIAFPLSLLFSAPGMAIYHLFVLFISSRPIPKAKKRMYLSLAAFLITYISMVCFFYEGSVYGDVWLISLAYSAPYIVPFIACALLFDYIPKASHAE